MGDPAVIELDQCVVVYYAELTKKFRDIVKTNKEKRIEDLGIYAYGEFI